MALDNVRLRKLLKLFYLSDKALIAELKSELRQERDKTRKSKKGGGDFHVPFWDAAKRHIAEKSDLEEEIVELIAKDPKHRTRLYPLLKDGFLLWWNEKRRQRNEPLTVMPKVVRASVTFEHLNGVVRVENILAINVADHSGRLIYPYFSEKPELDDEAARLGLWLLDRSLPEYASEDIRILDVLRGQAYDLRTSPFEGHEEQIFLDKYSRILDRWRELRPEYGLD